MIDQVPVGIEHRPENVGNRVALTFTTPALCSGPTFRRATWTPCDCHRNGRRGARHGRRDIDILSEQDIRPVAPYLDHAAQLDAATQ